MPEEARKTAEAATAARAGLGLSLEPFTCPVRSRAEWWLVMGGVLPQRCPAGVVLSALGLLVGRSRDAAAGP